MSYVKCVKNEPYIQVPDQPSQEEALFGLTIGKVYKAIPDRVAEKQGMIRVIDESYGEAGSEHGYLYPADYFEPFLMPKDSSTASPTTIYLDEYMKGILHAEAIAADKSISALVREWLEERLDLPAPL
jgi:hypothetical protein